MRLLVNASASAYEMIRLHATVVVYAFRKEAGQLGRAKSGFR